LPEDKTAKNGCHVDLAAARDAVVSEVGWLVALGAKVTHEPRD